MKRYALEGTRLVSKMSNATFCKFLGSDFVRSENVGDKALFSAFYFPPISSSNKGPPRLPAQASFSSNNVELFFFGALSRHINIAYMTA